MADPRNAPSTHMSDLKGRIRVDTTAPSNPRSGDMYFNSTTSYLLYYNGTAWVGVHFNN